MATAQQDAVTRARLRQEKEMKARTERDAKIGKTIHSPANLKTSEQLSQELKDGKVKVTVDAPPTQPGDQKGVKPVPTPKAPEVTSGDQNDVKSPEGKDKPTKTKKAKKQSNTVTAWKQLKNFPVEGKISLLTKENPKRKDAARRFAFYKEGMTVAQYLTVTKENSITNALANADIRWDVAAGFITVTVK